MLTTTVAPPVALSNQLLERANAVQVVLLAALRADIAGRLRRALVAYDDASTSGPNELDRFGQGKASSGSASVSARWERSIRVLVLLGGCSSSTPGATPMLTFDGAA